MNKGKLLLKSVKLLFSHKRVWIGRKFNITAKETPDVSMLVAMSKYFNVSIDYLITGKDFDSSK